MGIGEIINKRRLELNLTLEDVGNAVGVGKSTVKKWESGYISNMKRDKISALAKILNLNPVVLIMGEESESDIPLPEGAIPVDLSTFIKVPVYGEVSAGNGCLAEDNIIGYELVSPGSINKYETIFFLKVKGDSMEPQICEGDFALIQRQTSVDSGSLAVVTVDDENGVIKKVIYGDDWIELISFNPYYPIRRFEGADVQRIRVVGLVKEIKRKFN